MPCMAVQARCRVLRVLLKISHDTMPPSCRTFATLLNSSRVSEQRRQQRRAGAPVAARNRTTATVYAPAVLLPEAVAGPGVWQLTYTYAAPAA